MNKEAILQDIIKLLGEKLEFLEDKPEENLHSTVNALWLLASGQRMSAEQASIAELPELNDNQIKKLYEYIDQRVNNIPLAYITGRQSFMNIELITDKRALIPRKETEILGKKALELCN